MYIKSHLEEILAKAKNMFGVIRFSGSRQVGKTALLRKAKAELPYITLGNPIMPASAMSDSSAFFRRITKPACQSWQKDPICSYPNGYRR